MLAYIERILSLAYETLAIISEYCFLQVSQLQTIRKLQSDVEILKSEKDFLKERISKKIDLVEQVIEARVSRASYEDKQTEIYEELEGAIDVLESEEYKNLIKNQWQHS